MFYIGWLITVGVLYIVGVKLLELYITRLVQFTLTTQLQSLPTEEFTIKCTLESIYFQFWKTLFSSSSSIFGIGCKHLQVHVDIRQVNFQQKITLMEEYLSSAPAHFKRLNQVLELMMRWMRIFRHFQTLSRLIQMQVDSLDIKIHLHHAELVIFQKGNCQFQFQFNPTSKSLEMQLLTQSKVLLNEKTFLELKNWQLKFGIPWTQNHLDLRKPTIDQLHLQFPSLSIDVDALARVFPSKCTWDNNVDFQEIQRLSKLVEWKEAQQILPSSTMIAFQSIQVKSQLLQTIAAFRNIHLATTRSCLDLLGEMESLDLELNTTQVMKLRKISFSNGVEKDFAMKVLKVEMHVTSDFDIYMKEFAKLHFDSVFEVLPKSSFQLPIAMEMQIEIASIECFINISSQQQNQHIQDSIYTDISPDIHLTFQQFHLSIESQYRLSLQQFQVYLLSSPKHSSLIAALTNVNILNTEIECSSVEMYSHSQLFTSIGLSIELVGTLLEPFDLFGYSEQQEIKAPQVRPQKPISVFFYELYEKCSVRVQVNKAIVHFQYEAVDFFMKEQKSFEEVVCVEKICVQVNELEKEWKMILSEIQIRDQFDKQYVDIKAFGIEQLDFEGHQSLIDFYATQSQIHWNCHLQFRLIQLIHQMTYQIWQMIYLVRYGFKFQLPSSPNSFTPCLSASGPKLHRLFASDLQVFFEFDTSWFVKIDCNTFSSLDLPDLWDFKQVNVFLCWSSRTKSSILSVATLRVRHTLDASLNYVYGEAQALFDYHHNIHQPNEGYVLEICNLEFSIPYQLHHKPDQHAQHFLPIVKQLTELSTKVQAQVCQSWRPSCVQFQQLFVPYVQSLPRPCEPKVWIDLRGLAIVIETQPMDKWLELLYPLWIDELAQQHIRRQVLQDKKQARQTTNIDILSESNDRELQHLLQQKNASIYIERVKKVFQQHSYQHHQASTLMKLELEQLDVKMEVPRHTPSKLDDFIHFLDPNITLIQNQFPLQHIVYDFIQHIQLEVKLRRLHLYSTNHSISLCHVPECQIENETAIVQLQSTDSHSLHQLKVYTRMSITTSKDVVVHYHPQVNVVLMQVVFFLSQFPRTQVFECWDLVRELVHPEVRIQVSDELKVVLNSSPSKLSTLQTGTECDAIELTLSDLKLHFTPQTNLHLSFYHLRLGPKMKTPSEQTDVLVPIQFVDLGKLDMAIQFSFTGNNIHYLVPFRVKTLEDELMFVHYNDQAQEFQRYQSSETSSSRVSAFLDEKVRLAMQIQVLKAPISASSSTSIMLAMDLFPWLLRFFTTFMELCVVKCPSRRYALPARQWSDLVESIRIDSLQVHGFDCVVFSNYALQEQILRLAIAKTSSCSISFSKVHDKSLASEQWIEFQEDWYFHSLIVYLLDVEVRVCTCSSGSRGFKVLGIEHFAFEQDFVPMHETSNLQEQLRLHLRRSIHQYIHFGRPSSPSGRFTTRRNSRHQNEANQTHVDLLQMFDIGNKDEKREAAPTPIQRSPSAVSEELGEIQMDLHEKDATTGSRYLFYVDAIGVRLSVNFGVVSTVFDFVEENFDQLMHFYEIATPSQVHQEQAFTLPNLDSFGLTVRDCQLNVQDDLNEGCFVLSIEKTHIEGNSDLLEALHKVQLQLNCIECFLAPTTIDVNLSKTQILFKDRTSQESVLVPLILSFQVETRIQVHFQKERILYDVEIILDHLPLDIATPTCFLGWNLAQSLLPKIHQRIMQLEQQKLNKVLQMNLQTTQQTISELRALRKECKWKLVYEMYLQQNQTNESWKAQQIDALQVEYQSLSEKLNWALYHQSPSQTFTADSVFQQYQVTLKVRVKEISVEFLHDHHELLQVQVDAGDVLVERYGDGSVKFEFSISAIKVESPNHEMIFAIDIKDRQYLQHQEFGLVQIELAPALAGVHIIKHFDVKVQPFILNLSSELLVEFQTLWSAQQKPSKHILQSELSARKHFPSIDSSTSSSSSTLFQAAKQVASHVRRKTSLEKPKEKHKPIIHTPLTEMKNRAEKNITFKHLRLNEMNCRLSFSPTNVEDYEAVVGFHLKLHPLVYTNKTCTLQELGARLRRDIIMDIISQVNRNFTNLGKFLHSQLEQLSPIAFLGAAFEALAPVRIECEREHPSSSSESSHDHHHLFQLELPETKSSFPTFLSSSALPSPKEK